MFVHIYYQSAGFKSGEFRGHKSGGMKSGVSVHCAQQLEWRHVLRHVW